MYRNSFHLWILFSHNRTKINILIGFSFLSDCDLAFWSTDLNSHGLNGTTYIPGKFNRNSFKNNREIKKETSTKMYTPF